MTPFRLTGSRRYRAGQRCLPGLSLQDSRTPGVIVATWSGWRSLPERDVPLQIDRAMEVGRCLLGRWL